MVEVTEYRRIYRVQGRRRLERRETSAVRAFTRGVREDLDHWRKPRVVHAISRKILNIQKLRNTLISDAHGVSNFSRTSRSNGIVFYGISPGRPDMKNDNYRETDIAVWLAPVYPSFNARARSTSAIIIVIYYGPPVFCAVLLRRRLPRYQNDCARRVFLPSPTLLHSRAQVIIL